VVKYIFAWCIVGNIVSLMGWKGIWNCNRNVLKKKKKKFDDGSVRNYVKDHEISI
jgi:hypothetical protein